MLKLNLRPHFRIFKKNQKGLAVLEMIPVIIVVMVLLRYTYGFFGVIHSATMQSIAARNYTFETFRHRSRLAYLREGPASDRFKYRKGVRLHGIRDENSIFSADPLWDVGVRDISFPSRDKGTLGSNSFAGRLTDQSKIAPGRRFNQSDGANPVWLSIRYGMCVDFQCGD